jgi:hypothetical protein
VLGSVRGARPEAQAAGTGELAVNRSDYIDELEESVVALWAIAAGKAPLWVAGWEPGLLEGAEQRVAEIVAKRPQLAERYISKVWQ